jgi:hypothetical protein
MVGCAELPGPPVWASCALHPGGILIFNITHGARLLIFDQLTLGILACQPGKAFEAAFSPRAAVRAPSSRLNGTVAFVHCRFAHRSRSSAEEPTSTMFSSRTSSAFPRRVCPLVCTSESNSSFLVPLVLYFK